MNTDLRTVIERVIMNSDPQSKNFAADMLRCTADWINMHGNDREVLARNLRDLTGLLRSASLMVRLNTALHEIESIVE